MMHFIKTSICADQSMINLIAITLNLAVEILHAFIIVYTHGEFIEATFLIR